MTKITKRLISFVFGFIAFVAFSIGVVFTAPQLKTAKAADTAISFNVAYLEGDRNDGYLCVRMDTDGLTWNTYYNDVEVSKLPTSVANYTTINGRTLTEIADASTSVSPVLVTMQPADTFSFIRVFIPLDFMTTSMVRSVGVLDGWALAADGNNYTCKAVTFLRQGDTLVTAENYTANTKLTAADITISDAQLVHRVHASRGADSYMVDINVGKSFSEYDTMYGAYKYVRGAIYINGKSIDECNAELIASDVRFNDPSTYTYFPQNSTDPGHLDYFVKPIGLWGTSTGFRLSIFQEVVADVETITITIGSGCWHDGSFMVSERIEKNVLTQKVVDLTNKLTFLDNSKHNPAEWGETKLYFIHTNNEVCWTGVPKGGCLNEYDPSDAGGGQIQMKYVTFNGSTLYDINKNDNGSYGSTQGNIVNGGNYAPILVTMTGELGSSLKLTVPTAFTNGKAGHEEVVVKKGFNVKVGDTSYYVSQDVVFANNGGVWTKSIKANEIQTQVMGIITKANRNDGGSNENFVIFQLSNNDYAGLNTTAIADISSLYGYIDIDGAILESKPNEPFFNVWGFENTVAFRAPGLNAEQLQRVRYITVKAGAKFPAYASQNGGSLTYFVTTEDVTFVHDIPNDSWTIGEVPAAEVDITDELALVHQAQQRPGTETYLIKTNNNYWTAAPQGGCLNEYDAQGLGGGQEQMKYIYFNGTSLYDINKDDHNSYGSQHPNIVNGSIYAPIMAQMGTDNGKYSFIQLHIPTLYGGAGETANENHKSIEVKAGFSVTVDGTTYVTTKDVKWVNVGGTWVNEKDVVNANTISIANGYIGGDKGELLVVEVNCSAWNFTRDAYDYNYYSDERFVAMRKNIYVNGVSLFEINTTVDDSAYNYVSSPQTNGHTGTYNGETYETFANPVFFHATGNVLKIHIHLDYINTLPAGDITIAISEGFVAYNSQPLMGDVSEVVARNCTVIIEGDTQIVLSGKTAVRPATPVKDMTSTSIYAFDNWYIVGTDRVFNFNEVITSDVEVEARFTQIAVNLIETEVLEVEHQLKLKDDNWLTFILSESDYASAPNTHPMGGYAEFLRIGFLDNIVLNGVIQMNNGSTVATATLLDVYNSYGALEGPYMNIWGQNKLALRLPVGDGVEEIIIKGGTFFPAYAYISGAVTTDTRYMVTQDMAFVWNGGAFIPKTELSVNIQTSTGASVRISAPENIDIDFNKSEEEVKAQIENYINSSQGYKTTGIRFETKLSLAELENFSALLESGAYTKITFGTIIAPTDYLMGGQFTHAWLTANGKEFLDITSSASMEDDVWAKKDGEYVYYYATIGKLKIENYNRAFSGLGYVKLWVSENEEECVYVYSDYVAVNSRSAAFVAQAAINDRSDVQTEKYTYYVAENNNYSPYEVNQLKFLQIYLYAESKSIVNAVNLTALENKGGEQTVTVNQKLNGPYVKLQYSTNVNVWGVFTYTDGTKTANEDFYMQAGTTEHKQYLDIFRTNGVAYGMNTENITLQSISFKNAELTAGTAGVVKLLSVTSQNKTVDTNNQEIYLTVQQADGSEMTVGAHLGLGGALTYLAKSGVYEGRTSSAFGNVKLSTSTSDLKGGYYGSATSSLPVDENGNVAAVNLINNADAGRQIQQSWYAQVGAANGYEQAYCYTESSAGKYWPYNPVQAGDVVSNPSQIVDYEINEAMGYIYVKTRAMDWAKGYDSSKANHTGTVVGGVTTKSYTENYYRLNDDGTLVVNNAFVDWNGFTDMEAADWASTELPAVYPVHTLNYYVSNIDGDGSWKDAIEYNNKLEGWTGGKAFRQSNLDTETSNTKVEEWFAWANGGNESAFALGMYIPNVTRFTSGRSKTSTAYYTSNNRDAITGNTLKKKGLMSNMQPIVYDYQSTYVSNTSYTAPGVAYRMEAYTSIEYSYVLCVGSVKQVRDTFYGIYSNGTVTNAGAAYERVGLDAWARSDKTWTW